MNDKSIFSVIAVLSLTVAAIILLVNGTHGSKQSPNNSSPKTTDSEDNSASSLYRSEAIKIILGYLNDNGITISDVSEIKSASGDHAYEFQYHENFKEGTVRERWVTMQFDKNGQYVGKQIKVRLKGSGATVKKNEGNG